MALFELGNSIELGSLDLRDPLELSDFVPVIIPDGAGGWDYYKSSFSNLDNVLGYSARIDSLEDDISINASQISGIQLDIDAIELDIDGVKTDVSANSSSILTLEGSIEVNEGDIDANAAAILAVESDISTIKTDIDGLETEVSANASSILSLDTRVSTNENDITSNASAILAVESSVDTLETDVNGLETDVSANASSILSLDTRVTTNEGDISSNASAILGVESDITIINQDNKALIRSSVQPTTRPSGEALEIGDIWIDADDDETSYVWDGSFWVPYEGSLKSDVSANASSILSLDTRVTDNEGDISSNASAILAVESNVTTLEDDTRAVQRQASEPTTRASGDPLQVGDIWVDSDDDDAAYIWDGSNFVPYDGKVKDIVSSNASSILTLETEVGDNTTAIASLETEVQNIEADIGNVVIRSTTAPTQRPSGEALMNGDIWVDTDDGDKPYAWDGSAFQPVSEGLYTDVAGLNIQVGDIENDITTINSDLDAVEADVGTIGARAVLFTNSSGKVASITLLSGTEGSAISIAADQINIDGTTTFSAGYDPSTKETPAGAQSKADAAEAAAEEDLAVGQGFTDFASMQSAYSALGKTIISGGVINTGLVDADAISVTDLSAINATIGGINMENDRLYTGDGVDGYVGLAATSGPTDRAFWAGAPNNDGSGAAKFYVTQEGKIFYEGITALIYTPQITADGTANDSVGEVGLTDWSSQLTSPGDGSQEYSSWSTVIYKKVEHRFGLNTLNIHGNAEVDSPSGGGGTVECEVRINYGSSSTGVQTVLSHSGGFETGSFNLTLDISGETPEDVIEFTVELRVGVVNDTSSTSRNASLNGDLVVQAIT